MARFEPRSSHTAVRHVTARPLQLAAELTKPELGNTSGNQARSMTAAHYMTIYVPTTIMLTAVLHIAMHSSNRTHTVK